MILQDSLSSEEQERDMIQKKKKKKKGFVINLDLPNVVSSKDVICKEEEIQRPTGRLGIPSENDRESPARRGQQRKRARNNSNSRRSRDSFIPPPPQPGQPGRGCFRNLIHIGDEVCVIKKEHQSLGTETQGNVERHLTKSPYHPRGIKVMLTSGLVGRVIRFVDDDA
jgi:uncharacterized repeat protein (TIGR03833 family)